MRLIYSRTSFLQNMCLNMGKAIAKKNEMVFLQLLWSCPVTLFSLIPRHISLDAQLQ